MSGRVRNTLSDGRRVTGYRKTLRQQTVARKPVSTTPLFWRLRFMLPQDMRFLGVKLGPFADITGAAIGLGDFVHVIGVNPDWCVEQGKAVVRKLAPDWCAPIEATLKRDPEPGPTESGPPRPPLERTITLIFKEHSHG